MKICKQFVMLLLIMMCFLSGCCTMNNADRKTTESEQSVSKITIKSDAETDKEVSPEHITQKNADSSSFEEQPQIFSYIANKKSGKLHYPDCASVRQMNEENKLYLECTREEAVSKGYEPCQKCEP